MFYEPAENKTSPFTAPFELRCSEIHESYLLTRGCLPEMKRGENNHTQCPFGGLREEFGSGERRALKSCVLAPPLIAPLQVYITLQV